MARIVFFLLSLMVLVAPAAAAEIDIVVDVSQQTMTVTVDGVREYQWDVSTGKKGYRTPKGSYQPTRMHREYYSRKYDNAPMPYSIFFRGGYAIHGTSHVSALGSPASHGCVRLQTSNAKVLYNLVREHGRDNTSIRIKA
ncbi:L,D-transpeptidase [Devosia sp. FKR38]|uniref:L,D-transpeptidase n=1 Tax=Devosia sp. FKR38 TaxID=2562312 RepID=UPI0020BD487B|nr:L,D-transpeptidase [Devosia sp. FKR38]